MKGKRLHSHAPTLAARGELHFNELLILVCAPVIIIDLMNIYVPCLKFRDTRKGRQILWKSKNVVYTEMAHVGQTRIASHTYRNALKHLNRHNTHCEIFLGGKK